MSDTDWAGRVAVVTGAVDSDGVLDAPLSCVQQISQLFSSCLSEYVSLTGKGVPRTVAKKPSINKVTRRVGWLAPVQLRSYIA